jgi:Xaa-Pro aminopeptidase
MNDRVARLREVLEEPLLVTNPVNVVYLAGFRSSNAALLVEPDRVRLFTDFRYAEAARNVEGPEFVETPRALVRALTGLLSGRIGFEANHVTYADWETLRSGGLELVPRDGLVERLRAVKDEGELESIRRAAAITDRAYERLADERFTGRTERELAWRIEQLFRDEGAEELAFPIIVAAGVNGSRPHAEAAERTIEPGNVVTVEPGIYLEGLGGIRIEDLVVVTADGCEVLNRFTKDLTVVG